MLFLWQHNAVFFPVNNKETTDDITSSNFIPKLSHYSTSRFSSARHNLAKYCSFRYSKKPRSGTSKICHLWNNIFPFALITKLPDNRCSIFP